MIGRMSRLNRTAPSAHTTLCPSRTRPSVTHTQRMFPYSMPLFVQSFARFGWLRMRYGHEVVVPVTGQDRPLRAIEVEECKLYDYFLGVRLNITKLGASDLATTTSGQPSPLRSPAAMP